MSSESTPNEHPYRRVFWFNLGIVGISSAAIIIPPLLVDSDPSLIDCLGTPTEPRGDDEIAVGVAVDIKDRPTKDYHFSVGKHVSQTLGEVLVIPNSDFEQVREIAGFTIRSTDPLTPQIIENSSGSIVATCNSVSPDS